MLCDEIDALRDKIDVLLTVLDKDGDVWIDVDPIDHKKPKVLDADNGVSVKVRQLVGFRLDELIEASHHAGWIRAQMHAHKGD